MLWLPKAPTVTCGLEDFKIESSQLIKYGNNGLKTQFYLNTRWCHTFNHENSCHLSPCTKYKISLRDVVFCIWVSALRLELCSVFVLVQKKTRSHFVPSHRIPVAAWCVLASQLILYFIFDNSNSKCCFPFKRYPIVLIIDFLTWEK